MCYQIDSAQLNHSEKTKTPQIVFIKAIHLQSKRKQLKNFTNGSWIQFSSTF